MTSVVFCDANGVGWKVGRVDNPTTRRFLEDEAEWLQDAARVPDVREHVVAVTSYHPEQVAIERECVDGRPGGWSQESALHDLHWHIERAMVPHGWTAPEFKADSYVMSDGGKRAVMVDASMPSRVGANLLRYARDLMDGRKRPGFQRPDDLAFYIGRETNARLGTITPTDAQPVLDELALFEASGPDTDLTWHRK